MVLCDLNSATDPYGAAERVALQGEDPPPTAQKEPHKPDKDHKDAKEDEGPRVEWSVRMLQVHVPELKDAVLAYMAFRKAVENVFVSARWALIWPISRLFLLLSLRLSPFHLSLTTSARWGNLITSRCLVQGPGWPGSEGQRDSSATPGGLHA